MKSILKTFIGVMLGTVIAVFAISLWRNEEMNWEQVITTGVGAVIGLLILAGIKRAIKKAEDDTQ
ncbi:hypothetical protein [Metaplanococcus flavidus]|uniref:hypothetical protein n=1 Tax=Metaplanococcus flavidus TaxID=569883 RepID=UPI00118EF1D8